MQQIIPCNCLPEGGNNFPSIYAFITPSMNQQMCMPMQLPFSPCFPYSCQSPFNNCTLPPSYHAPTIYLTLLPQTIETKTEDKGLPATQPVPPVSQAPPVSHPPRVPQLAKTSHLTSSTDFHPAPTDMVTPNKSVRSVEITPQNQNERDLTSSSVGVPKQHLEDFSDERLALWKFDVELRQAEVQAIFRERFTSKLKPLYPLLQTTLAQKVKFLESARCIRRLIDDIKKVESQQEKTRLNQKLESMIENLLAFYNQMKDKENELRELKDKLLYEPHPFSSEVYPNAEELGTSDIFTAQNVQELKKIWANQNEYLQICADQVRTNDQEVLQFLYEVINTAIGYVFVLFNSGQEFKDSLKKATSEEEKAAIENALQITKNEILHFFGIIKEQQACVAKLISMVEIMDNFENMELENQN